MPPRVRLSDEAYDKLCKEYSNTLELERKLPYYQMYIHARDVAKDCKRDGHLRWFEHKTMTSAAERLLPHYKTCPICKTNSRNVRTLHESTIMPVKDPSSGITEPHVFVDIYPLTDEQGHYWWPSSLTCLSDVQSTEEMNEFQSRRLFWGDRFDSVMYTLTEERRQWCIDQIKERATRLVDECVRVTTAPPHPRK